MNNIRIHRCTGEQAKQYQGYVEPEDGTWRLFVDHEGIPHLLIQTTVESDDGKTTHKGMISVDNLLPEGTTIKDVMNSTFGGAVEDSEVSAEEFTAAELDFGPNCGTLNR